MGTRKKIKKDPVNFGIRYRGLKFDDTLKYEFHLMRARI